MLYALVNYILSMYILVLADRVHFLIFELEIGDKSSNTTFYNFTISNCLTPIQRTPKQQVDFIS
jgi:hypothetical protein